ncbi:MAG TPA: CDP-alcohol phosphatidyltransferase family protein [Planctomycetota bacterium]
MTRFLDGANAMSLSRLLLAALVWVRPADGLFLASLMALAAVSDVLDGFLGRRLHGSHRGTADVGAWLDPLCDKVFTASAAAAVVLTCDPPRLVMALLLLRELLLLVLVPALRLAAGRDRFHGHDFRARASGKAATVAQFTVLLAILFAPAWSLALAWLCGLLGLVAVAERVVLTVRELRAPVAP